MSHEGLRYSPAHEPDLTDDRGRDALREHERMRSMLDGAISITLALIAVNVAISLIGFWALRHERYAPHFLFISHRAARGENWSGALLSHFAHGDLAHLFVNMLTLFFFGPRVEEALGPLRYLLLYAVSGAVATFTIFLFHRKDPRHSALGASGAIAGVMLALVVIAPTSTMYLMFAPIPLPAPVFAVLYLILSSVMMGRGDHIAHEAHLGGAIAGLGLAGLLSEQGFGPLIAAVNDLVS